MLWVNHLVQQSSTYPLIPCILCLGGTVWSWPQLYIYDPQPRGGRSRWCFFLHPVREGIQFALPAGDTGWSRRWVSWSNTGQHWLLGWTHVVPGMKGYLRAHVEKFKYGILDSDQWKEFFLEHFKKEVKRWSNRFTITKCQFSSYSFSLSSPFPLG